MSKIKINQLSEVFIMGNRCTIVWDSQVELAAALNGLNNNYEDYIDRLKKRTTNEAN